MHAPDNIQQIPQLTGDISQQSYPINIKDNYHVWSNAAGPNLISNWPQEMPEFPIKPSQFQQKPPTFPQYQPDMIQKNAGSSDQSQVKNQKTFGWPIHGSNLPSNPNVQNPSRIHLNHNNEEVLPEKDAIGVIKDVPVVDRKKDGKNLINQSKSGLKSTEDSDYNIEEEEEATTEPPRKKKKHRKVNKIGKSDEQNSKDVGEQQLDAIHSGLQAEFMDNDGEADRPGGAVVSLALGPSNPLVDLIPNEINNDLAFFSFAGILITIGLVMVVSCRTTTVRKRVRRGKGYAHDADFLVNGMYL